MFKKDPRSIEGICTHKHTDIYAHFSLFSYRWEEVFHESPRTDGTLYTHFGFLHRMLCKDSIQRGLCETPGVLYRDVYTYMHILVFFPTDMAVFMKPPGKGLCETTIQRGLHEDCRDFDKGGIEGLCTYTYAHFVPFSYGYGDAPQNP